MKTLHSTLLIFGVALLLSGCGSDSDETAGGDAPAAKNGESKAADENLWATYEAATPDTDTPPFDHSFTAPPPIARPDPDEVLARYEKDCADEADSAECRGLRREVERVFLDALIGLRDAGQAIDADVLRAAASAETPQLACIGLRDRLRGDRRTEADWELIAAALDNPWRAPRNAALTYVRIVPPDDPEAPPRAWKMLERAGDGYSGNADMCIDGWRDPLPNPGLAGHYPNARYRPFASNAERRWFTTPDSPEKVFAYLAKAGYGPPQTAEELKAAATAKYMEAMTQMTSGDAEDAQKSMERMMKLAMRQGIDWSREFTNLTGTGEVRYVMLNPNQAIAVFSDEYLDATSIVAPAPPVEPNVTLDAELAKREAYAHSVFGF